jgi:molybdenum cofactor guanylyltransferase
MGADKALVSLAGQPLVAHVAARLAPQCSALAVNANGDPTRFRALGLPVLPDGDVAGMGPLAGVLAAMDWAHACGYDQVLTAAVDTPFLPRDLVARLAAVAAPVALAETADGLHATTGLWAVDRRDALRDALVRGMRKVTDWTATQAAIGVRFPDTTPPPFFNVNRPEDLAQAETWAGGVAKVPPFDIVAMVDWSARSKPSPRRDTKDAIFLGIVAQGQARTVYCRTRADAMGHLTALFDAALQEGHRVLAGFDFPFGYPRGFARAITGQADPFALWQWLATHVEDDPRNGNNRLDVADRMNAMLPAEGPFWSHPATATPTHVPFRKPPHAGHPFAERRRVEQIATGASTCFQLYGNGAVASQSLLGLPRLQQLRDRYGAALAVRPFDTHDAAIVLAEIYPSLLKDEVDRYARPGEIKDAAQVRVMAQTFAHLDPALLATMLSEGDREEGWILGLGHADALTDAARRAETSLQGR